MSLAYRELIKFTSRAITTVSIVPDFGWLLVLASGTLIAFDLHEIMPTSEPSTWVQQTKSQGIVMSSAETEVAFARVGTTKGRTLSTAPMTRWYLAETILQLYMLSMHGESMDNTGQHAYGLQQYASDLSYIRGTPPRFRQRSTD